MKLSRLSLVVIGALAGAMTTFADHALAPHEAHASVSIAVGFDALVKDADAVGILTPVDSKSVWEDGRIVTYTRVKIDQAIAGDAAAGSEAWVRTMGGVVGKVGQLVDGEPVLTAGRPSLVFMRKWKQGGNWEVSARAQGQFPISEESRDNDKIKIRKVMRSSSVGMLLPPKPAQKPLGPIAPQSVTNGVQVEDAKVRLAGEVLHDRPLDDAVREITTAWKRLHAAPSDAKK